MRNAMPNFRRAEFRKSSVSDPNQECVEVAQRAGWVQVRDSKTAFDGPQDGRLTFRASQFAEFLGDARQRS
jgi:hypothetical protein